MACIHWTEIQQCSCGMKFRDMYKEAVHRHNFPVYCRKQKDRPNRTASDARTDAPQHPNQSVPVARKK